MQDIAEGTSVGVMGVIDIGIAGGVVLGEVEFGGGRDSCLGCGKRRARRGEESC